MTDRLETEAVVMGGGVSGCAAALALRLAGLEVTLVEKSAARPQRFCGEFVSGEGVELLCALGLGGGIDLLAPTRVRRAGFYGPRGARFQMPLARPGLGLSRKALDSLMLDEAALAGVRVIEGAEVAGLAGGPSEGFELTLRTRQRPETIKLRARAAAGAFGKRSSLDRLLRRGFFRRRSPFAGVKRHYRGAHGEDEVSLHLFPGGYCGAVGIEGGKANTCLLAKESALRAAGGRPEALIAAAQQANPALACCLNGAETVEGSLMTISQIYFGPKERVAGGVFLVGDAAGLTAPFLGTGISNGIRSAIVAADFVSRWLRGRLTHASAAEGYDVWWRRSFARTQRWGHWASRLLCRQGAGEAAVRALDLLPALGQGVYRLSRGASLPEVSFLPGAAGPG